MNGYLPANTYITAQLHGSATKPTTLRYSCCVLVPEKGSTDFLPSEQQHVAKFYKQNPVHLRVATCHL